MPHYYSKYKLNPSFNLPWFHWKSSYHIKKANILLFLMILAAKTPSGMNHRYFLKMAYDGTAYHGWQVQPNGDSIQVEVEKALSVCFGSGTLVVGAGRTDTGVHAREMFAHFDLDKELSREELEHYCWKLNNLLSADIAITAIIPVIPEAHARFDAMSRTYEYHILTRKNPFRERFCWYWQGRLEVDDMNQAAGLLIGLQDFQCFSKVHTDVKHYLCDVKVSYWHREDDELIYTITANRFLRNMVRAVVGTLFDIGRGKLDVAELKKILKSKDRSSAGASMPAKGLSLVRVEYPEGVFRG